MKNRIDYLETVLDIKGKEILSTTENFKREANSLQKYNHFVESRCLVLEKAFFEKHFSKPSQKMIIDFKDPFKTIPTVTLSIESLKLGFKNKIALEAKGNFFGKIIILEME